MTSEAPTRAPRTSVPTISEKDLAQRTNFMLGIPVGMKLRLEKFSKDHEVSTASIVRKAIAEAIGYDLPAESARVSTKTKMSDEEKKAKQKAANKDRRDKIKALMEKFDKGEVTLD